MQRFPKKRAVITGAGSGLGRALALDLARRGWRVLVSDIKAERAAETAALVDQAGGEGLAMACDVTQWAEVKALADRAVESWGGADVVVNNAGVPVIGAMADVPLDDWRWAIDINLMGVVNGCKAFIPVLAAQGGGHIVNTASAAGFTSLADMAPYNATKAAVISLSETLRVELAAKHIGVTVACPTTFKTNLFENVRATDAKLITRNQALFARSFATAEGVAAHVWRGVAKNKLYVITQPDAKLLWAWKRLAPELYTRTAGWIFKRGLFDKALGSK
jgi:NAD(P)-dependent dehydrogenase (short-subunit alcohol dehydrogenase family)